MTGEQVLIVSNPEDEHTKVVEQAVREVGGRPVLYYPEDLGTTSFLSMNYCEEAEPSFHLRVSDKTYDFRAFYSIWHRRPRTPGLFSYGLDKQGIDFARDEWSTFTRNIYNAMVGPLWVSRPLMVENAANKILQLALAKRLGLTIPETVITNDPEQARKFYHRHEGKIIGKATGKGWVYEDDEESVAFVLTNRIELEDMHRFDEVTIAPVTFQEEVPKAFEVRANVVGQECLAIKIDSQRSELSKVDWRRYDLANTPYEPFDLPKSVEVRCLALCQQLELEYGAIDIICTPTGEFVFLEVNPAGQFLWAEDHSGVLVSQALARLLTGVAPALRDAKLDLNGE